MSATTTIEVPRGLDALSPEEQRQMELMRDDGPEIDDLGAAPAPTAPPAAAPEDLEIEVPDEPEPAPVAGERRQTMVPQQALHQARAKLKEAEKKAADAVAEAAKIKADREKEQAVLAARLDMIAKVAETQSVAPQPTAPVATEEALPDKNTDPIGYFEALVTRQGKQIENLTGIAKGAQEAETRRQQGTELRNWGVAQELAFEKEETSYREAMDWLKASWHNELAATGITDPAIRENIIGQNAHNVALRSRQDGANFAKRLYDAAVARGYKKKAVAPDANMPAIDLMATPALRVPDDRAARIAEGRDSSTTIGSVGSAPAVRMTPEKLASLPDEQWEALYARIKDNPAKMREIFGS